MLSKERRKLRATDIEESPEFNRADGRDVDDIDSHFRPRPLCVEFLAAIGYAIISHTALICYLLVLVDMTASAGLLVSLPLPLMVLLWGTLSTDRPTKTFWVTMIAYAQMVVVLKCLALWLTAFSTAIGGLEPKDLDLVADIMLLAGLYMHRVMLKRLGIWQLGRDERLIGVYSVDAETIGDGFGEPDEMHESVMELARTPSTNGEELLLETDLRQAKVSYLTVNWYETNYHSGRKFLTN